MLPDPDELFGPQTAELTNDESESDAQEFAFGADAVAQEPMSSAALSSPAPAARTDRADRLVGDGLPPLPPARTSLQPTPPPVPSMRRV